MFVTLCVARYMQLHRDSTVQSLTISPTLRDGVVVWEDSPLVRAVRMSGRLSLMKRTRHPWRLVSPLGVQRLRSLPHHHTTRPWL